MDYDGFDAGMDLGTEGFSDMGFANVGFNGGPGGSDIGGFGMDALLGAMTMQAGGFGWEGGDPLDAVVVYGVKKSIGISLSTLDWLERFFDNTLDNILAQIQQTQQAPKLDDLQEEWKDIWQKAIQFTALDENGDLLDDYIEVRVGGDLDVDDDGAHIEDQEQRANEYLEALRSDPDSVVGRLFPDGITDVEYDQDTGGLVVLLPIS